MDLSEIHDLCYCHRRQSIPYLINHGHVLYHMQDCEKNVVQMGTGKPGRMISFLKNKYYCFVSFQFLGPKTKLPSLHKTPTAALIASWKEFLVIVLALVNVYQQTQQQSYPCYVFIWFLLSCVRFSQHLSEIQSREKERVVGQCYCTINIVPLLPSQNQEGFQSPGQISTMYFLALVLRA